MAICCSSIMSYLKISICSFLDTFCLYKIKINVLAGFQHDQPTTKLPLRPTDMNDLDVREVWQLLCKQVKRKVDNNMKVKECEKAQCLTSMTPARTHTCFIFI